MRPLVLALSLLCAAYAAPRAGTPTPQTRSGLILGRVVDAVSGAPVRDALVQISGRGEGAVAPTALTGNDGQFVFAQLPAGNFALSAGKSGYRGGMLNQRRPEESDINMLALSENERKGDVTLRLWKCAVIAGTITDEFGDPVTSVEVRAYRRLFVAGHARLGGVATQAFTDDRGVYRIANLAPGEYVVAVPRSTRALPAALADRMAELNRTGSREDRLAFMQLMESARLWLRPPGDPESLRFGAMVVDLARPARAQAGGPMLGYPTEFFSNASVLAAARIISMRPGQQIGGVDITMHAAPVYRVSGRLVDESGSVAQLPVRLLPGAGADFDMEMSSPSSATITHDEGRFTLMAVSPGEYTLRVLQGPGGEMSGVEFVSMRSSDEGGTVISTGLFDLAPPSAGKAKPPTRAATMPVVVGEADVTGLSLTVRNGVRLSGVVEFTGGRDRPNAEALRRLHPIVEPRNGLVAGFEFEMTANVTADLKFETVELPPGSYFLRAPNVPQGWHLESVMLNGRDISDVPIDIADTPIGSIVMRFTDTPATLAGTVQLAARDDKLDEAIVIACPADRAGWVDYGNTPRRLQRAVVSRDGGFVLEGLLPGEYLVVAIRDDFMTDWRNPAFLETVAAQATRVSVAASSQSISLTLRRVR